MHHLTLPVLAAALLGLAACATGQRFDSAEAPGDLLSAQPTFRDDQRKDSLHRRASW